MNSENNDGFNVTVVGGGYVGLSYACALAVRYRVMLLDIDERKVKQINSRISPIADRDIERWFEERIDLKLEATLDKRKAYENADIVFIAVPTDFDEGMNVLDMSAVSCTVRDILSYNNNSIIVIKSTVPIGYTAEFREKTGYHRILFVPEFLREGRALHDTLHPSRIIIGADAENPELLNIAEQYVELTRNIIECSDIPVQIMNSSDAEAVKLFSNAYLAMRISFFNELDMFAEMKNLSAESIINGMSHDLRIGDYYNNPSFGYGGYCLPKDTRQLLAQYADVPQNLVSAIVESNLTRIDFIVSRIIQKAEQLRQSIESAGNLIIGMYRINMKKNSDNIRQSTAMEVLKRLSGRGYEVEVYEPLLDESIIDNLLACRMQDSLEQLKADCSIIIANRYDPCLDDVKEKVYTRDLFNVN